MPWLSWPWLLYLPGTWLGGYVVLAAADCSRALRPWQRVMLWLLGGLLWPLVMMYFIGGLLLLVLEWRGGEARTGSR
jgi:hypothetical protein